METDGGWISISEASRLYQKDRKWVSNQINAYNLETRKRGNQKQLRLTDLISHRGEPDGNGTAPNESPAQKSETVPDAVSHEIPRFETEIRYLKERVVFLESDIAERKEREAWLRGQVALPAPERNGWSARLRDWWQGVPSTSFRRRTPGTR